MKKRFVLPVEEDLQLLGTTQDALLVLDLETERIVEANPQACALLGYSRATLCTQPLDALVPAKERTLFQSVLLGTKEAANPLHFRLSNGSLLPVELHSIRLQHQGRKLGILLFRALQLYPEAELLLRLLHTQDFLGLFGVCAGRLVHANPPFATLLGYERPELLLGRPIDELLSADALRQVQRLTARRRWGRVAAAKITFCHHQGYTLEAATLITTTAEPQQPTLWGLVYSTQEAQQQFYARERQILEGLVRGEPQEALLDALCYALEARIPGGTCTVLLLREGRLWRGASHMPSAYDAAIEGIAIGPNVGSCGTAAFLGKPVWAHDVQRDARWAAYRDLADTFGFQACWSYPILDRQGTVLGTFAMYFSAPRAPLKEEQAALARSAALAALILETHRLQQEHKLLSEVACQTTNGVVITDAQRRVVWVNEGFTRLTGYRLEDVRGKSLRPYLHGPQTDAQTVAEIRRGLLEGHPVRVRIYNYRKDGTGFWNHLSIDPLWDSEGTLVGFIGIENDVTDLVTREQELERARAEAEAAARLKSAFLANLSHEVRTPLNSILGFTDLLEEALATHQLEDLLEFTGIIRRAGRRLLQLINDMLELSRLEADRLTLEQEPCSLASIVQEAVAELQPLAMRKKLHLHARIEAVPPIRGDARRLHQVLVNLIGNAIKYTDQGEVCVELTAETLPQPQVVLRVIDTGRGIPPEFVSRIFDPFWQAPSEAARGEGSGLGLTITKRLVEQMHGQITVDSILGRGTTFTVTFPALPDLLSDAKS